jgi:uncharacterized protein (TIGR02611 family)
MESEDRIAQQLTPPQRRSGFFRKSGVAIIGVTVILIGIPLIPLVGPGWLIVFTGLAILASEFPWAGRLRDRLRNTFLGLIGKQDQAK